MQAIYNVTIVISQIGVVIFMIKQLKVNRIIFDLLSRSKISDKEDTV